MADTPPPKQGGWNTPDPAQGITAVPTESGESRRGYKVKALPEGLTDLPDLPGGWHRPRTEDTLLKPTDETIIMAPVDEEDEDLEQALPPDAVPATQEEVEKFLSPEDLLADLPSEVEDAPLRINGDPVAEDVPESPEDVLNALSMMGDDDEEDPDPRDGLGNEMLALGMLAGAPDDEATTTPPTEEDTAVASAEDDPAEIARRRMAQLAGGAPVSSEPPAGPTPAAVESARMADEVLGQRFFSVQQQMAQLRMMVQSGQITADQAENEINANQLIIPTEDGRYWRMSLYDTSWLRSTADGMGWEPANPIWLEQYLATQQMGADGLPLLNTGPAESSGGLGGAATVPMSGIEYMPLPNQVSANDMGQTVVGSAAFREQLDMTDPGSQPTVAGATVAGATIPSASVGYGSVQPGIPAAVDESLPPDLDEEMEGELSEQADQMYRRNTTRNIVLAVVGVVTLMLLVGLGGLLTATAWYDGIVAQYDAQLDALANYEPEFQTVVIQDSAGREIARLADAGDRTEVPLDTISQYLIHAVVSTRNPTFFGDPGWDTGTTIGAYIQSFSGTTIPVNKTITQLVAESLVLGGGNISASDADLIVVAGELGRRYDKEFILQLFLNEFAFGNNTYGVEAASQFYLGKPASELNIPEAALLAAIMEDPNTVDPVSNRNIRNPILSVARRMVEVGCLDIPGRGELCVTANDISETNPQFVRALGTVELLPFRPRQVTTEYPHFVQLVRQQLEAVYGQELYTRGFRVRTTLNTAAQQAAETLLNRRLTEISGTGITTGATAYLNSRSGAVLAYVGSPDFDDVDLQGQRDYLREYRQPGTMITPLLYAPALQGVDRNGNGSFEFNEYYTPATMVWDVPTNFQSGANNSAPVAPNNLDGRFYGPVSVREALVNQFAVAAARTYTDIGESAFRTMADRMGITFLPDSIFNIETALGATPVRPIDLISAYTTFASGGTHRHWYVIETITDSNGIEVPLPEILRRPAQDAFSPQTAFLMANILSDDLARNAQIIPRNSALVIPERPNQGFVATVAGQNAARTNFWTIGVTADVSIGVWFGTPNADVPIQNQTGLSVAAPAWNQMMRQIAVSNNIPSFTDPGGLTRLDVCNLTGTVFGPECAGTRRSELFAQTRQPPPSTLGLVVTAAVNTWTGQRANQFCPSTEDTEQRVYLNNADQFIVAYLQSTAGRNLANQLGIGQNIAALPTSECDQNTQLPTVVINSPTAGQSLVGQVQITGQVSAPADFNRYTLEIAPQGTQNFTALPGFPTSSQQTTPGGVLGTWDTNTVTSGGYTLRLTAFSSNGGYVRRSVDVVVNNPTPTPTATPTPTPQPIDTLPPLFTPLPFDPVSSPQPLGPTATPAPF